MCKLKVTFTTRFITGFMHSKLLRNSYPDPMLFAKKYFGPRVYTKAEYSHDETTINCETIFVMLRSKAESIMKSPLELKAFARFQFGDWAHSSIGAELLDEEVEEIKARLARTGDEDLLDDAMEVRRGW